MSCVWREKSIERHRYRVASRRGGWVRVHVCGISLANDMVLHPTIPDSSDKKHGHQINASDLPLPLLCLGGAYIPLEQQSGVTSTHDVRPWKQHKENRQSHQNGDGARFGSSSRFMLKRDGKKILCVDRKDAHVLGMNGESACVHKRNGTFMVTCGNEERDSISSSTYLSVPLHFGLEMVQSFPKSYLWLSEQSRSRRLCGRRYQPVISRNPSMELSGVDEIGKIPVYSIPNLQITQICDTEKHLPVEYNTYFLSKRHLTRAWRSGRGYLISASLASRQERRQHIFDALHAKAGRIASRGGWFGPPKSASDASIEVHEDEDGLMEPAEVQEIAAELGLGGMPHGSHGAPSLSLKESAKTFLATLACGAIATLSPIVQGCSVACESAIASIPLLDRLLLGDTIPPRRAMMREENVLDVFESVHARNMEAMERMKKKHANPSSSVSPSYALAHDVLSKRLAMSALWMGISLKLLLQQHLTGSQEASVIVASSALADSNGTTKSSKHNRNHANVSHGTAHDPVVMDVLSTLIGSLQANDFVKTATLQEDGSLGRTTQSLDLETILSMHNGLSIEYKGSTKKTNETRGTDDERINAEGILLIGDISNQRIERHPAHGTSFNPSSRSHTNTIPPAHVMIDHMVSVPVGVHNGVHLMPHVGGSVKNARSGSDSRDTSEETREP